MLSGSNGGIADGRTFEMKRTLIRSSAFVRAAKQLLRKNPQLMTDMQTALTILSEDAFNPKLKTHKLKGYLEGSWACSGGYNLRIIFEFVQFDGSNGNNSSFGMLPTRKSEHAAGRDL